MKSDTQGLTSRSAMAALAELHMLLKQRYPEAIFKVYEHDDPPGVYLSPMIDVVDMFEVLDVIIERLVEMQVDEELDVYVVPDLPPQRIEERLREHKARLASSSGLAAPTRGTRREAR